MSLHGRYKIRWIIGIYLYLMQIRQIFPSEECVNCGFENLFDLHSKQHLYGLGRHRSSRSDREGKGQKYITYDKATKLSTGIDVKSEVVVNQALDKAIRWVMSIRDTEYGWGQDTLHTVVALLLAKPSWFRDDNLEARLVARSLDLQLMRKLWKHKEMPLTKGLLALNIIGMIGLGKDPRSFYSKDLVGMMDHIQGSVHFEDAFALVASCISGKKVKKYQLRKLVHILRNDSQQHSVDTQAVALLALRCTELHSQYNIHPYITAGINALMREQTTDGSFASNIHSTAIALQAMIANGHGSTWSASKAQQYIVSHQMADGSFGNIFDTNAVLPVLAGNSLLSLEMAPGHVLKEIKVNVANPDYGWETGSRDKESVIAANKKTSHGKTYNGISSPIKYSAQSVPMVFVDHPGMVNVTYIIWIGNEAHTRYNMSFLVPVNTPFLNVMQMAAEEDENFEFATSKWANRIYVHKLAGRDEQQSGFWFWLLYRLRNPPTPELKPSNSLVSSEGVTELKPEDGDYVLFWYHQI